MCGGRYFIQRCVCVYVVRVPICVSVYTLVSVIIYVCVCACMLVRVPIYRCIHLSVLSSNDLPRLPRLPHTPPPPHPTTRARFPTPSSFRSSLAVLSMTAAARTPMTRVQRGKTGALRRRSFSQTVCPGSVPLSSDPSTNPNRCHVVLGGWVVMARGGARVRRMGGNNKVKGST